MSQTRKVRLNLDISKELRDYYHAQAKARGLTLSEYIRRAIRVSHELEEAKAGGATVYLERDGKKVGLVLL